MPFSDTLNPQISASRGSAGFSCLSVVSGLALEGSRGCGMGAPAPARPADSLPCQSSNNSTETPSKLSPYQRKNAFSINENLTFCIERHGLEKIGFLTLTFPKHLSLKEAMRRFNSLATHFLDKHFVCWVRVVEFTKDGRPHFHLIVVCREDIRTGFDFGNYVKMARLSSNSARRRKNSVEIRTLARSLNPTPALRAIWADLREVLPEYQFGRAELIPVRKNGAALARYVGGYIRKSMDFRPVDAKGARLIAYSKGFPRKVVGHAWSFHCEGSELWRAKVGVFAKLHRIRDLGHMRDRFGDRWAWWLRGLISSLNLFPLVVSADGYESASAGVSRYVNGLENTAFVEAMGAGVDMMALHLSRPKLPEILGVNGQPDRVLEPPARLRSVFDFHFSSWDMTAAEIAERSDSDRRRMVALRQSGRTNITEENFQAARDLILFRHPLGVVKPHEQRSRNFSRIVHPEYFKDHYSNHEA